MPTIRFKTLPPDSTYLHDAAKVLAASRTYHNLIMIKVGLSCVDGWGIRSEASAATVIFVVTVDEVRWGTGLLYKDECHT